MWGLKYILGFLSLSVFGQESIEATFLANFHLESQIPVGIDNFGNTYTVNQATFQKKDETKTLTYSNVQLGNISSANCFNPLKINLFYKNFNTAIILDNRLAEIYRVGFNSKHLYRNVSHISTGYDNTLWIFNQDNQQLELYDYKADKVRATTIPVQSIVLDLKSDYNYCWLLTKNYLYVYNYFGSLLKKLKNDGFTEIDENGGNLILKKDNQLLYLKDNTGNPIPIKLPNLLINRFLLTNETLYIYDGEILHQFQLKID